jgi:AbrB family looped-hinge helix DNA binding protein
METVTLSSKFQLVIPRSVREKLNFAPGQKFFVTIRDNRVELIPCEPLESLEGFAKGMNTDIDSLREREDRV